MMNNQQLFAVTLIGVGVDTEVYLYKTNEDARKKMVYLINEWLLDDFEEMYRRCIRGFSSKAQCNIEIEIHEVTVE